MLWVWPLGFVSGWVGHQAEEGGEQSSEDLDGTVFDVFADLGLLLDLPGNSCLKDLRAYNPSADPDPADRQNSGGGNNAHH